MGYSDYKLSDDGGTVTFHGEGVQPFSLPAGLDATREAMAQFDADKRRAQDRGLEAPFDSTGKRGGIVSAVESPDLTSTLPMGRPWMTRDAQGGIVSSVESPASRSDVAQGRGGIVSSRYTIEDQPRSTGTVAYEAPAERVVARQAGALPADYRDAIRDLRRIGETEAPMFTDAGAAEAARRGQTTAATTVYGGDVPMSAKDRELMVLLDQINAKRAKDAANTNADLAALAASHPLYHPEVPADVRAAAVAVEREKAGVPPASAARGLDALAGEAARLRDVPAAVKPLSGAPSTGPLPMGAPARESVDVGRPSTTGPVSDIVETRSRPWEAAGDYPDVESRASLPQASAYGAVSGGRSVAGPVIPTTPEPVAGAPAASTAATPDTVPASQVSTRTEVTTPSAGKDADAVGAVGPTYAYAMERLRNAGHGGGRNPAVTAEEAAGVAGPILAAAERDKENLRRAAEENIITHGRESALRETEADLAGKQAEQEQDVARRLESERRAIWQAGEDNERDLRAKVLDPNRTLNDMGGFKRTAAAVFMGLGEFARLYLHANQNAAKEVIDDAINRDILQQQADYTRGVERGKRVQGLLADYINAGFPMDSAKRLATSAVKGRVIEQRAADLEDAKMRMTPVQYEQAKADIDKAAQDNIAARTAALADWKRKAAAGYDPLKRVKQEVDILNTASGADRNVDKLGANTGEGGDGGGKLAYPVYTSDGKVAKMTTQREANAWASMRGAVHGAQWTTNELAKALENKSKLSASDIARIESLQESLLKQLAGAVGNSTPGVKELERRLDALPRHYTPWVSDAYRKIGQDIVADYNARIQSGVLPDGSGGGSDTPAQSREKPAANAEPVQ